MTRWCVQTASVCIVLTGLLCGCHQSSNPDQTVAVNQSKRTVVKKPVISGDTENPDMETSDIGSNQTESGTLEKADAQPVPDALAKTDAQKAPETVTVKKPPLFTRNGKTYHPGSLHKNNTTLVLAYQNDIRADYIISDKRSLLTEDQIFTAKRIAMEYDRDFNRILKNRSERLAEATSPEEFEAIILEVKMDTADLIAKIKSRIYVEVLTHEQTLQLKAKFARGKEER